MGLTSAKGQLVTLTNIMGTTLTQIPAADDTQVIDLGGCAAGVYLVVVYNPQTGQRVVKRVVKE